MSSDFNTNYKGLPLVYLNVASPFCVEPLFQGFSSINTAKLECLVVGSLFFTICQLRRFYDHSSLMLALSRDTARGGVLVEDIVELSRNEQRYRDLCLAAREFDFEIFDFAGNLVEAPTALRSIGAIIEDFNARMASSCWS